MSDNEFHYIDRSNLTPNHEKRDRDDHLDLAWCSGFFKDGRPFRVECWAAYQMTLLSYYFSTTDLEELKPIDIKKLLESENLIKFDDENFKSCGYDGINVDAKKKKDASGNEMWEATVIVGDEDGTFVSDNVRLRKYEKSLT